jgi:diguanylate cyclase (GGDEF)-like protein
MKQPSDYADLVALEQYRSFSQKMPVVFFACASLGATELLMIEYPHRSNLEFACQIIMMVTLVSFGLGWIFAKAKITPKKAKSRMLFTMATCTLVAITNFSSDVYDSYSLPDDTVAFLAYSDAYLGVIALIGLTNIKNYSIFIISFASVAASVMFWRLHTPGGEGSALITIELAAALIFIMTRYFNDFARLVKSRGDIEALMHEAEQAANSDVLTNLPNRRYFFAAAAAFEARAREKDTKFALGLADLDGFKHVNDTYGHRMGDRVLAEVATRFRAALQPGVELCRIGGDEFAFLSDSDGDSQSLLAMGESLAAALEPAILVGDLKLNVGCSVGFAVFPDMCESTDTLYEVADLAVAEVKRTEKGRTAIFSQEHKVRLAAEGAIEQALRDADLEQELYPVFQPIVDSLSGETRSFECLARWKSRTVGSVSPAVFIPVAEHAGLISRLTIVMLRKALEQMKTWPEKLGLSFNLSPYDLNSSTNIAHIMAIVGASGVSPSRISFEITETALIQDFSVAKANVENLRRMGLGIALDDFGAGYSSLSHVRGLPLNKIKIDRQFIADIGHNAGSQIIVKTILALCADMKLDCIIEGAETREQVDFLNDMGCRLIKGYYYSYPMTAEKVLPYLRRSGTQPAALCA